MGGDQETVRKWLVIALAATIVFLCAILVWNVMLPLYEVGRPNIRYERQLESAVLLVAIVSLVVALNAITRKK